MNAMQSIASRAPLAVAPDAILEMAMNMDGTVQMLVTPQVAEALLTLNIGNRSINPRWVTELARRMRRGAWKNTGEPIIVSREAILNDGQHRLKAVVESSRSQVMDVRFGVARDAFVVGGTGKPRTAGQVLQIAGHADTNRLAAAAALLIRYRRLLAETAQPGAPAFVSMPAAGGATNATHDQIMRFVEGSPELMESVREVRRGRSPIMRTSHMVCAHYLTRLHDRVLAPSFWSVVVEGVTDELHHPARLLRERLTKDAMAKLKMPADERLALALKAWLLFKSGRRVTELRFRAGGEKGAESFPCIPVLHLLPDVED